MKENVKKDPKDNKDIFQDFAAAKSLKVHHDFTRNHVAYQIRKLSDFRCFCELLSLRIQDKGTS